MTKRDKKTRGEVVRLYTPANCEGEPTIAYLELDLALLRKQAKWVRTGDACSADFLYSEGCFLRGELGDRFSHIEEALAGQDYYLLKDGEERPRWGDIVVPSATLTMWSTGEDGDGGFYVEGAGEYVTNHLYLDLLESALKEQKEKEKRWSYERTSKSSKRRTG